MSLYAGVSAELVLILQDKIADLTFGNDLLFKLMPIRSENVDVVQWEQLGNYIGLTGGRVADGGYFQVKREGLNKWTVNPGRYGDQKEITEEFLSTVREPGTFADPLNISKQIGRDQDHLVTRMINRLKKIGWDLFTTGTYSVLNGTQIVAGDQFALTPFVCSVPWSDPLNSYPIRDLRQAKLRHRGHSLSFGRDAVLPLNSQDVNNLLANNNPDDLGAKRVITVGAGAQPMTLEDVNRYLMGADLPQIVEYDDNYFDESGNLQQFIAQGYGCLIGHRTMGDEVADFTFTKNAHFDADPSATRMEGDMSNIYFDFEWENKPPKGISTLAFSGAPKFKFPSAIVPFRC